jgi:hypothetical protein
MLLACASSAAGQTTVLNPSPAPPPPSDAADDGRKWSVGASVYAYLLPDETDYVQPTVMADRGWLHLEARYNYEDLRSGSVWIGCNFSGGEAVEWTITPMVGGVFGNTRGFAPGYKGTVAWKRLQLYSEGEYVADANDSDASFWYSWSELSLSLTGWFRAGAVEQRTWVRRAEHEVNRGVLVGFTRGTWDVAAYVFNPTTSRPGVVLAVSAGF